MVVPTVEPQVVPQYLQDTASKLRTLPKQMEESSAKVYKLSEAVTAKQEDLKSAEANLVSNIASEMDGSKSKFTNETARQAEFMRRKPNDKEWMEAYLALKKARDEYQIAKQQGENFSNEFSAIKHLSSLYSAWLTSLK